MSKKLSNSNRYRNQIQELFMNMRSIFINLITESNMYEIEYK